MSTFKLLYSSADCKVFGEARMNVCAEKVLEYWDRLEPRYLEIDNGRLTQAAHRFADQNLPVPDWQMEGVLPKNHLSFVSHVFYTCAINFCFINPEPPHQKFAVKNPKTGELLEGSAAAAACFYRIFGEDPVDPRVIMEISACPEKSKEFFRGIEPIPLLEERRKYLYEISVKMIGMDPMGFLKSADFYVFPLQPNYNGALWTVLAIFPDPFGGDIYQVKYRKRVWDLPFLKRAQLFFLVYQGRARHSGGTLPLLRDADKIGPIADCAVPNALRELKILRYSPQLRYKIDNRLSIPRGERAEIEIRTATVVAMIKLLNLINSLKKENGRPPITMVELDNAIWKMGRKTDFYHHLTLTTDY